MPRAPHLRLVPALATALLTCLAETVAATEAMGFRGNGTGRFTATPPLDWSAPRLLAWKTELKAHGHGSPVLVGDLLVVSEEPLTIVGLDSASGVVRWRRRVDVVEALPEGERAEARRRLGELEALRKDLNTKRATLVELRRKARRKGAGADQPRLEALSLEVDTLSSRLRAQEETSFPEPLPVVGTVSATPVTDGRSIFAVLGNGVVARLERDGRLAWAVSVGPARRDMRGYFGGQAASPLLVDGRLVVALNQLRAFDPLTGRELWRSIDYRDYGTPAVVTTAAGRVLATPNGELVDPRDGKVLATGLRRTDYVGPTADGPWLYVSGALLDEDRATGTKPFAAAYDLARWRPGMPISPVFSGTYIPDDRQYAVGLVDDGRLFTVDRAARLTVLNASTGERLAQRPLDFGDGQVFSSPVRAGGAIFIGRESGHVLALEPVPPFRTLGVNVVEELHATPAFEGTRVYVRTRAHVWCFDAAAK